MEMVGAWWCGVYISEGRRKGGGERGGFKRGRSRPWVRVCAVDRTNVGAYMEPRGHSGMILTAIWG